MDTDRFIVHVTTENIYEEIATDVDKKTDTSNYEAERPLQQKKIKKP